MNRCHRIYILATGVVFCLASSVRSAESIENSPEQQILEPLLGTWEGTTTMFKAEWTPKQTTSKAKVVCRRVLGGAFVEMRTESVGQTDLFMYTYDKQRKTYRNWYFSSFGNSSESTGTWDAKTQTLHWTNVADPKSSITATSTLQFVNENQHRWTWLLKGRDGAILMRAEGEHRRLQASKDE